LSISERLKSEISLYGEGKVSASGFALNIVKLKRAFPKLPDGWYTILEEMLDEEKFTDQRLTDAVNHLIKTSIYPEPTIANLLTFDRKAKIWTYEEALAFSNDFSTERRRKFWEGLEVYDQEKKLWREKR
jgi:hypothetical protein